MFEGFANHRPSMERKATATRPFTACKPGKCDCKRKITVGPDDHLQTRQPTVYGTSDWRADYGRRSLVESANAVLKGHHAKIARGSFRVMASLSRPSSSPSCSPPPTTGSSPAATASTPDDTLPDGPVAPIDNRQPKPRARGRSPDDTAPPLRPGPPPDDPDILDPVA